MVVTLVLALLLVLPLPSPSFAIAVDSAPVVTTEVGMPGVGLRRRYGMPSLPVPVAPRRKTSFVTAAVEAVGPSVVRIDTERLVERVPLEGYLFPGLEPESQRKESGQGSGVILSDEGVIMTNAHVVNKANKVTVTLTDGRTFEGTVKGSDEFLDLAVIKIKPTGRALPTAPLGRSEDLQVGDWVVAIGNAVGLDSTVTLGIVSSLSRSAAEVGIPNKKVNFIQTDAAINPGNSGGPLLNEFGEVIGVNTAIRANAAGIGFAIPIDTAEKAVRELAQGKKIPHAYLGISMSSLTPESAKQNNADPNTNVELPEAKGALVLAVGPDTPAAKAGFRKFDLIQELAGQSVGTAADAQAIVDASRVGQQLQVKVNRQNRVVVISVTTADISERLVARD
jgi:S1-C subfamily serine protease